jgi:hypothetical protein
MHIIHPTYSKSLLSDSPLITSPIPHYLRWKVLIEGVSDIIIACLISLKLYSKSSVMACIFSKNSLYIWVFFSSINNRLLIRKMNLKAYNSRNMLLYIKKIEVLHSFIAANIAYIQVKLNLSYASSKLHSGPIMPFVHILVYILDCLH